MARKGTTKYESNKQEKEVAKQFGGKVVIASGSLWFADSDVRTDNLLIECKTTGKDYYSVTSKVWDKIYDEATRDGLRLPLLIVDLNHGTAQSNRYVLFNPNHFEGKSYEYEMSGDITNTSFRLRDLEIPTLFGIKPTVKTRKTNLIMAMPEDTFLEIYEEDL